MLLSVLIIASLLAYGCGDGGPDPVSETPPAQEQVPPAQEQEPALPAGAPVSPEDRTVTPAAVAAVGGQEDPAGAPPETPAPTAPEGYDYSQPAPESPEVEDSFFSDAVFVGDSRTEGFILYGGLAEATAYTHRGLMVDTIFTKEVIDLKGKKVTVMDALRQTEFSKIYLMLGINELGWIYPEIFIQDYGLIIDELRDMVPGAQIYIQSLLPVTAAKSSDSMYKNSRIQEYNQLIRDMALSKEVFYVDVASVIADENGVLPEEAAFDGIHLKKDYCQRWLAYLKTHTVSPEEAPGGEE